MSSNHVRSMRDISARYARSGSRNDFDEFRAEMNRINEKQRFQTLERYIGEIYQDYPFIVRNRYYQFVPVRNERLTELIQTAVAQQQALNDARQQAKIEEQVKEQVKEQVEKNVDKEEQGEEENFAQTVVDYLPYVFLAIALLLIALLITLVFIVWRLSHNLTVVSSGGNVPSATVGESLQ